MLAPHPRAGGPLGRHTPLLVDGLRSLGCEIVVEPWGRHTEAESVAAKLAGRPRDIGRVCSRLSKDRFDALVVKTTHEWASMARDLPLLAATRRLTDRTVLQFHGGHSHRLRARGYRPFKLASRLLLELSDGLLVLSSEEERLCREFFPAVRIVRVRNPAPPEAPNAGGVNGKPGPNGVATLLFAGRLIPEKGVFDVLDAVAALRQRLPCRLVVAGKGSAEAAVAERVRALDLEQEVSLVGHLGSDALAAEYRRADAFVLPTYWAEGFPTAISEAMQAGLPILTTRSRGMADHLRENVNALFVPARDPDALAAAVERLLADPDLRERMARANRDKVREFAPDAVAREYLEALESVPAPGKGR
jgi:glycosyltransferase involved in cell wall biosynthesis